MLALCLRRSPTPDRAPESSGSAVLGAGGTQDSSCRFSLPQAGSMGVVGPPQPVLSFSFRPRPQTNPPLFSPFPTQVSPQPLIPLPAPPIPVSPSPLPQGSPFEGFPPPFSCVLPPAPFCLHWVLCCPI